MTQSEADALVQRVRQDGGGCCASCHEDQEEFGFPFDENYRYRDDGVVLKACCCDVGRRVDAALKPATEKGEGA